MLMMIMTVKVICSSKISDNVSPVAGFPLFYEVHIAMIDLKQRGRAIIDTLLSYWLLPFMGYLWSLRLLSVLVDVYDLIFFIFISKTCCILAFELCCSPFCLEQMPCMLHSTQAPHDRLPLAPQGQAWPVDYRSFSPFISHPPWRPDQGLRHTRTHTRKTVKPSGPRQLTAIPQCYALRSPLLIGEKDTTAAVEWHCERLA